MNFSPAPPNVRARRRDAASPATRGSRPGGTGSGGTGTLFDRSPYDLRSGLWSSTTPPLGDPTPARRRSRQGRPQHCGDQEPGRREAAAIRRRAERRFHPRRAPAVLLATADPLRLDPCGSYRGPLRPHGGEDEIPPKARIHTSLPCADCGENTMETRVRLLDSRSLCPPCFDTGLAGRSP